MESENRCPTTGQFQKGNVPWIKGKRGVFVAWNKGIPLSDERKKQISKVHKGKILSEETKRKMSESHKGIQFSEERKRKISERMKKRYENPEERKKQSERFSGKNNPMYGRTGESHPLYGTHLTKEHKRKLSEKQTKRFQDPKEREKQSKIMKGKMVGEKNPRFGKSPAFPKPYHVDNIPHVIRSPWEEEIARMLIGANIDYDYENRFPITIDDKNCNYNADFTFTVGNRKYVVEPHSWFEDYSYQKFEAFHKQYPDITFIILAGKEPNKEICDIFIKWDDRNELIDKIQEDLRCHMKR